jgi:ribosome-associated heat shock protein Hsp15
LLKIRLDKFVWCVRLCKTRSQGTELISKGQIKLNTQTIKPSKELRIQDIISVHKNNAVFSYKVIELLDKRVGAALIENFILDITPIEEKEKFKAYQLVRQIYRQNGDGKPTKKDRRDLDSFLNIPE